MSTIHRAGLALLVGLALPGTGWACGSGESAVEVWNFTPLILDDLRIAATGGSWSGNLLASSAALAPGEVFEFCIVAGDWDVSAEATSSGDSILVESASLKTGDPLILAQ